MEHFQTNEGYYEVTRDMPNATHFTHFANIPHEGGFDMAIYANFIFAKY